MPRQRASNRTRTSRPRRRTPSSPPPATEAPVAPAPPPAPAPKTTVGLKAEPFSLSPDLGRPDLFEYMLPEFVRLTLEAVAHFKIDARAGHYPKHEELVNYFVTRRLSDGRLISSRQARFLATFCRPVDAMKGGNS